MHRFKECYVEYLTDTFLGTVYETRGGALSRKEKIEVFLRHVGDPGFQGENVSIHQGTVNRTISEVARKMCA